MPHGKHDANIPLLTEVIVPLPTLTDIIETPPAPVASAAAPPVEDEDSFELPVAQRETVVQHTLSQQDWERLEAEVREKVLRQLQDRIDFVIEQRVRDGLADVLQTAVEGMAAQIRNGLHQTLDEVISRAVSLELVKLKKTNI
ncbi:EspF repeat-containing protein [Collimonas silvisoli]|uniref:EspF repeat-containing protein n=1 Tax=Collimonas silvisoli TaxID=2825884 RepID=UPI001B8CFE67|nr:EspF repeat-containing protein [Collimonas silvisoli]